MIDYLEKWRARFAQANGWKHNHMDHNAHVIAYRAWLVVSLHEMDAKASVIDRRWYVSLEPGKGMKIVVE
jgi:hypothetical protein